MATNDREQMVKPDFMSEEDWEGLKNATASLERIRGDAKADVARYLANPEGWSTGKGSPSGLPTLLLTMVGRKSGKEHTTPLVFLQDGDNMVVVASLAGYDAAPAWYLNVMATPECWVQCDHKRMRAIARDASPEERATLWPRLVAMFPTWGYFQSQTDRPFGIVILTPTASA